MSPQPPDFRDDDGFSPPRHRWPLLFPSSRRCSKQGQGLVQFCAQDVAGPLAVPGSYGVDEGGVRGVADSRVQGDVGVGEGRVVFTRRRDPTTFQRLV